MTLPTFHIPDEFWGEAGEPPSGRLVRLLGINGTQFQVEALPVTRLHGYQVGSDAESERRLEGLIAELDIESFQTVQIRGKAYVLVITPVAA